MPTRASSSLSRRMTRHTSAASAAALARALLPAPPALIATLPTPVDEPSVESSTRRRSCEDGRGSLYPTGLAVGTYI